MRLCGHTALYLTAGTAYSNGREMSVKFKIEARRPVCPDEVIKECGKGYLLGWQVLNADFHEDEGGFPIMRSRRADNCHLWA